MSRTTILPLGVVLLLGASAAAHALSAQLSARYAETLPADAPVRFRLPPAGEYYNAILVRIDPATLVIARCPRCAPQAIPRSAVTELYVSLGSSSQAKHALVGAALGGIAGAVLGRQRGLRDDARCHCIGAAQIDPVIEGFAGAFPGLAGGALWPTEHWVRVVPPGSALRMAPGRGGSRLALVIPFR